jgi:hypothetical protein
MVIDGVLGIIQRVLDQAGDRGVLARAGDDAAVGVAVRLDLPRLLGRADSVLRVVVRQVEFVGRKAERLCTTLLGRLQGDTQGRFRRGRHPQS